MKKALSILLAMLFMLMIAACAEESTQTVEITMDNWQDYFELVVLQPAMRKADGDPATRFVYALKLKDEYAESYKAHAAYTLPDDFTELYTSQDKSILYMMAEAFDGGFELYDVCHLQATFSATYDQAAAEVLDPPTFGRDGSAEAEILTQIFEGSYVDYLFWSEMAGEQAEANAHVMAQLDDTDVMLNTGDESAFTCAVAVELTDISGTLPIWE